jgi:amyloid beta (A4) precursor protein-binding family B protein 2 (Fe65-like)
MSINLQPVRFAVRSLGWTEIAEEELTPERSSKAVNRAIVDLSTGRNDYQDNVSKWGDVRVHNKSKKHVSL